MGTRGAPREAGDDGEDGMATFVLVHGAWHGGWCWERVTPRLEAAGHRVLAPDLPGMGADETAFAEDVLGQWTDAMGALVAAEAEPVVLVGHSRGGVVVSTVAERMPERVALAIYLTAFLLGDGQSLADVTDQGDGAAAAVRLAPDRRTMTIDPALGPAVFYGLAEPAEAAAATARLCPEPTQPHRARLALSPERFGRVPRAYIEATEDRAIPLARQRAMQERWPCARVVTLASDHSPFLSMPERLAGTLIDLVDGTESGAADHALAPQ